MYPRRQIALAKALADHFAQEANLDADRSVGPTSPAIAAVDALAKVVEIGERLVRIEPQLGPTAHADLEAIKRGIAGLISQFVPTERQQEAWAYLGATAGPSVASRDPLASQLTCGDCGRGVLE